MTGHSLLGLLEAVWISTGSHEMFESEELKNLVNILMNEQYFEA